MEVANVMAALIPVLRRSNATKRHVQQVYNSFRLVVLIFLYFHIFVIYSGLSRNQTKIFFQYTANGQRGERGPHVAKHAGEGLNREQENSKFVPKMEETHVLDHHQKNKHVVKKNVLPVNYKKVFIHGLSIVLSCIKIFSAFFFINIHYYQLIVLGVHGMHGQRVATVVEEECN